MENYNKELENEHVKSVHTECEISVPKKSRVRGAEKSRKRNSSENTEKSRKRPVTKSRSRNISKSRTRNVSNAAKKKEKLAFDIFSCQNKSKLKSKYPEDTPREITAKLVKLWYSFSVEEKDIYMNMI